ncbi:MAG: helix-turn-helix domain-containing protein, partial [Gemmatimonadota bacterium]
VSASNKDLARAAQVGRFRDDLLYRLNVFPIHIPPLRERPGDIPELVRHFTALLAERIGRPPPQVTPEAMEALVGHPWPGNVRELANIVERLIILAPRAVITADDVTAALPPAAEPAATLPSPAARDVVLVDELDRYERTLITRALSAAGGNVAEAARRLATDRANLYRRMKRLGIPQGG